MHNLENQIANFYLKKNLLIVKNYIPWNFLSTLRHVIGSSLLTLWVYLLSLKPQTFKVQLLLLFGVPYSKWLLLAYQFTQWPYIDYTC